MEWSRGAGVLSAERNEPAIAAGMIKVFAHGNTGPLRGWHACCAGSSSGASSEMTNDQAPITKEVPTPKEVSYEGSKES